MHPLQIAALLALCGFAIYRQSTPTRVQGGYARSKLPMIYAGIGLAAGAFAVPQERWGWAELVVGAPHARLARRRRHRPAARHTAND